MLKQFVLSIGLFCSVAYSCGPEDITAEQLMETDCIEIANTIHAIYGLTKDWTTYDTVFVYRRKHSMENTTEIQDTLFFDGLSDKNISVKELVTECKKAVGGVQVR